MPIPPLEPNPNCILHTPLPSTWVTRFAHLFNPSGRVLDLACGAGRHSRYLLEFGYKVYALDRDTRGVLDLVSNPNFFLTQSDVENTPWSYPESLFDGILVTNYLHRPLYPFIVASLNHEGILIYETFSVGNERYGKPSNPHFLLRSGELLTWAQTSGLEVITYEHGYTDNPGGPAIIQRIVAQRGNKQLPLKQKN